MNPVNPTQKSFSLGVVLLFFVAMNLLAPTEGLSQLTYYSKNGSGFVWGTAASWSTVSHSGAAAGSAPGVNDNVRIGNGHTMVVNSNTTPSCATIIVNDDGNGGTLTLGNNTDTPLTLTVSGDITINTGGTIRVGGNNGGIHALVIGGNLINNGTFTMVPATTDRVNVTFNPVAATTKAIRGTSSTFTFNNVTIGGAGTVVFGDNTATARTMLVNDMGVVSTLNSGNTGAVAHTIQISGNLTNAGTLNMTVNSPTNQAITFNNSAPRTIAGANPITLYNMNITGTSAVIFGNSNTPRTINIANDLTINAGCTLQSGATVAGLHNIQIAGNVVNNGTLDLTTASATNQTITFNSSTAKTLSGSGTNTFRNVTMSTTSSSDVNINRSITINGVLNFAANGNLKLNATSNITLGNAATITNANSNRYIELDGTAGAASELIKTSTNNVSSWQILFPIGTHAGGYTPVDLTSSTMNNNPASGSTLEVKAIYDSSIQGQLRRTFRLTSNAASTTFSNGRFYINADDDVSQGDALSNYSTYWYLNTSSGAWATQTGTINNSPGGSFPTNPPGYYFSTSNAGQALSNGTYYYTIGSSTAYPNTWYSYKTGVWSNWKNWTLDPSGTTRVNGLNLPPKPGDEVVILNGITITNDVSGKIVSSTTIQGGGFLDMGATTGNTLGTVSGTGTLRIQGVVLPTGTYTSFVTAGTGGTVEYYNTSGTLPASQTVYNKLVLSNTTGAAVIFTTTNNLTVNSDFNITQTSGGGTVTWQISDGATSGLALTLNGNLTVSANGSIRAGSSGGGNGTPHSLTILGNITNNGSIKFFYDGGNLTEAAYTALTTRTASWVRYAVNVTFSGVNTQTVTCNNQTDFYRFIVNKGTGQQALITVNSSNTSNFRFFGPNDMPNNTITLEGDAVSNESLSIQNGTLQLTGSINIPNLIVSTGESYYGGWHIPETAQLWVNGNNVTIQVASDTDVADNGRQIYLFGKLRLTAGTIHMGYTRGLLGGGSGVVQVEGGTLNTHQLRTTYLGSTNRFSYVQTGGVVNVGTIGGIDVDYYPRFSLPFSQCSFSMSGATSELNVADPIGTGTALDGGILIVAASSNISVTGGTVKVVVPASAINFGINSTAPFYNLSVSKAGAGAGKAILKQLSFYESSITTTFNIPVKPLILGGDLTLTTGANSPTFDCAGNNLTVGGNFNIQTASVFLAGTNTITLNGSGAQTWTNNGTINNTVATTPPSLNNIVVNKSAGILTLAGLGSFPGTTGTTNGTIAGITITSGTLNDGGKTLTVLTTLSNSGKHVSTGTGSIVVSGPTTIGGSGTFGNLTVSTNSAVTTSGDVTIDGNLRLTGASSTLNIQSYALTVVGGIYDALTGITTAGFAGAKRIQTAGFRNDGGLTRQATDADDILFPVGTATNTYTPMTMNVDVNNGNGVSGRITVKPVNGAHPNATPASQSLRMYWTVSSTGFQNINPGGAVHKSFIFNNAGLLQGTLGTYKPARYNSSNFTWYLGTSYSATATTAIPDVNFTPLNDVIEGEYTTGNLTAGALTVYYSKVNNGNWNTAATWSTLANRSNTAGSVPCSICPVVVGDSATFNHTININANGITCGSLQIATGSTLDCKTFTGLVFGVNTGEAVSGTGTLRIDVSSAQFPTGDFKEFLGDNGGTVEWYGSTTTAYTIPSTGLLSAGTYYNLTVNPFAGQTITMPATNLIVYNNLTKAGTGSVSSNTGATRSLALKNFIVSGGAFNILTAGGFVSNFSLTGDLSISSGATLAASGAAVIHTLTTSGNITNNGTLNFNNTSVVNLTFTGTSNTSFGGASATSTRINNLVLNKGTDASPVLTIGVLGTTLNTLTNNWLILTNGTINFNNSATYSLNTAAAAYSIPSTVKLKTSAGTVNIIGNVNDNLGDLQLSGELEVAGGAVNINPLANDRNVNNDIEYAAAGTPKITVSGGSLYVNGAIRRPTTTLSGALNYVQTGGTVTVGGRSADNSRGVFEIENSTGSNFSQTGGSLYISRTNSGSSYADLYINPAIVSASTGGTIYLGMAATTQTMDINVTPALGGLSLFNNTTVNLESSPLATSGTLTINAGATLLPNALNVTIGGDLAINATGKYDGVVGGTNTTTFNGAVNQAASLSSTSTFLNITVNKSAGKVTLSGFSPTITNLNILSGQLDVGGLDLAVIGDIVNNSTQIGSGTITISGASSAHTITSSGGSFTNLSLGGSSTTKKVTVSGNLTIDGTLDFTALGASRYLFIGSNKLTFSQAGTVNTTNVGSTRFIRTNGVASDLGVVKNFPVATSDFTYAVGTRTNYTPVVFDNLAVTTSGDITVIPVDDQHPTADAIGEQILNYYWIVQTGTTAYSSVTSHSYQFPTALIGGSGAALRKVYLDALNPSAWTSAGALTLGSPDTNMQFTTLASLPATGGEFHYAAGTISTLPSPVTYVYSRKDGDPNILNQSVGGDWTLATNWTTSATGIGGTVQSVVPMGRPVKILAGTRINLDDDGLKAFNTSISGLLSVEIATIDGVPAYTTGHNLGIISGTGTLRTGSSTLPGGNYTAFVSAAGGTIEYLAPMSMSGTRTDYNNVSVIGAGTLTMTNIDLTLNGTMTIGTGTTLDNTANRNINIAKNWTNSGTFIPGTGSINFTGSTNQTIIEPTALYNVGVSKTGGNVILSGALTVNNQLTLTNGNIVSTNSNLLTLGSSVIVSGGSSSSLITGPVSKVMNASSNFTFPVGTAGVKYRPVGLANTSGAETWTVEYFSTGYNTASVSQPNLAKVSMFEYWNVSRNTPASTVSADVTVSYGSGSYMGADIGNVANLRVAHWDGAKWELPTSGGVIGAGVVTQSGDIFSGTVTVTGMDSFSPVTLGSLDSDSPLPVQWLSFTARSTGNSISLNWSTAQEINNHHFEVERSTDGRSFNSIGKKAAAGNSNKAQHYQFTDGEVSQNITYYYRIRQVDLDGKFDFSKIVAVNMGGESGKYTRWAAWPNPISNEQKFNIDLLDKSLDANNDVKVQVISPSGSVVFIGAGSLDEIATSLEALLHDLNAGVYVLKLTEGTHQEHFRIVRY